MPGEFFLILLGELIFIDDHREAINVNFEAHRSWTPVEIESFTNL